MQKLDLKKSRARMQEMLTEADAPKKKKPQKKPQKYERNAVFSMYDSDASERCYRRAKAKKKKSGC